MPTPKTRRWGKDQVGGWELSRLMLPSGIDMDSPRTDLFHGLFELLPGAQGRERLASSAAEIGRAHV